jgi:hypothetical protein
LLGEVSGGTGCNERREKVRDRDRGMNCGVWGYRETDGMDVEVNDNDAWGALQKSLISALILRTTERSTADQSIDCVTIWQGFVHLSHCLHSG